MFDTLLGGWQSIFPNGGDAVVVEGADWPVDGEARLAWFDWEPAGSSVIMKSRLRRSPFTVTKIISLSADEVTIGETVKNIGEHHIDVMWGSQVFLGSALLEPTPSSTRRRFGRGPIPARRRGRVRRHPAVAPLLRPERLVKLRSVPISDRPVLNRRPVGVPVHREPTAPQVTVTNPRPAWGRAQLGTPGPGRTCGTAWRPSASRAIRGTERSLLVPDA